MSQTFAILALETPANETRAEHHRDRRIAALLALDKSHAAHLARTVLRPLAAAVSEHLESSKLLALHPAVLARALHSASDPRQLRDAAP